MRIRRVLSSSVAVLLPLTVIAQGIRFSDVPNSAWFATYVHEAANAGIVSGYKDAAGNPTGKYGPGNSITIAEALKIAVEGAGYDEAAFGPSVESGIANHWASSYVSVSSSEKFELTIRTTNLNRPATRAQVASLFASAFRLQMGSTSASRFADVNASTEFGAAIEQLSADGVVSGDTDSQGQPIGTFRPNDPINRAEVAKMIMKAREVFGTPGEGIKPKEDNAGAKQDVIVVYDGDRFTPGVVRVKKGTTVTFRNSSTYLLWVASNPHPYHDEYAEFDAGRVIMEGETYSFIFDKVGLWDYHNHISEWQAGTVIVE